MGQRRLVAVGGVELCTETFGDAADPAILLVGGASAPMDWWRVAFCERLAAGGRHVIRYDQRDTGESTTCPRGAPDYTGADLVADAAGLIAALASGPAHVAGISMGGGIAQRLAIERPEAVAARTLLSTSPIEGDHAALPPMAPALRAAFADPPADPDWADPGAVAGWILAGERPYTGSLQRDEAGLRAIAHQIAERSRDVAAGANHWAIDEGGPVRGRLADIAVPTLVLHGTEDPLFPIGHGEALARAIPGARCVALDGVGHEVPPTAVWDRVVPEMLAL
ncbi:MAG: alpha/beta fold hydrolase [Solirubrobacteraceae bacterium]